MVLPLVGVQTLTRPTLNEAHRTTPESRDGYSPNETNRASDLLDAVPGEDDNEHDLGASADEGTGDRALRRRRRGRRHLGNRHRLSPADPKPRSKLRHPRSPGGLRRNVANAPLPRDSLRQRPLYLRVSLQAVDQRTDRHGSRD